MNYMSFANETKHRNTHHMKIFNFCLFQSFDELISQ